MDYIIMNICIVKLKGKYNLNGYEKKKHTESFLFRKAGTVVAVEATVMEIEGKKMNTKAITT